MVQSLTPKKCQLELPQSGAKEDPAVPLPAHKAQTSRLPQIGPCTTENTSDKENTELMKGQFTWLHSGTLVVKLLVVCLIAGMLVAKALLQSVELCSRLALRYPAQNLDGTGPYMDTFMRTRIRI